MLFHTIIMIEIFLLFLNVIKMNEDGSTVVIVIWMAKAANKIIIRESIGI